MRGRYQSGQGGSLAGFIIVGVLLALVLVGGIYGLNRYNAQKAADKTTASQQQDKKVATSNNKNTTDIPKDDSKQTAKPDDSKKDTSSSSTSTQPTTTAPGSSTNDSKQTTPSAVLPKTGPSDMFASLIAVTILGFAAAHFVQSRVRA